MYLLFDIGGTKMRLAASDGRKIFTIKVVATPNSFREGMELFGTLAPEIIGKKKVKAAAGGIAGVLDNKKSILLAGKNLRGWEGRSLKASLEKILKAPVHLENDAALAGLGEATVGAGKGSKILGYLTISTGVGGSRIVDGKIDQKTFGFEPGGQIIHQEKTLEWFISGADVKKRTGKATEEIRDSATQEKLARFLAQGINNLIVFWSPDTVVVGGSVMHVIPLDRVKFHLRRLFKIRAKIQNIRIKRATFGDQSGLWGALEMLRQRRTMKT